GRERDPDPEADPDLNAIERSVDDVRGQAVEALDRPGTSVRPDRGFLEAVTDAHGDDVPRLVYADWLEERGAPEQTARADFIRLQCRLATLPPQDPAAADVRQRLDCLLQEFGAHFVAEEVERLLPDLAGDSLAVLREAALSGRLQGAFARGFLTAFRLSPS